ncbi:CoA transferase [Streptomyces sp. NPDC002577]
MSDVVPTEYRDDSDDLAAVTANGPLAGIRVLELGGIGPGPFCGMLLGDLGAEVIRVERPGEAGRTAAHSWLHRNRRLIAVDLKDQAGAAARCSWWRASTPCSRVFAPASPSASASVPNSAWPVTLVWCMAG